MHDSEGIGRNQGNLADLLCRQGDLTAARGMAEEALLEPNLLEWNGRNHGAQKEKGRAPGPGLKTRIGCGGQI